MTNALAACLHCLLFGAAAAVVDTPHSTAWTWIGLGYNGVSGVMRIARMVRSSNTGEIN